MPKNENLISCTRAVCMLMVCVAAGVLAACGGGGGGGGGGDSVTISGTADYESVPNNTTTGALNYNAITPRPIRRATVQLIDGAGAVLGSTVTDDSGAYSLTVTNPNAAVRVRVRAESVRSGASGGAWDVRVLDNTDQNALYALDSAAFTPTASESRNLRAASGWGGSSYTSTRTAAPFAVLDVAVTSTQKVLEVAPNQSFAPLRMLWSRNNLPADPFLNESDADALAGGRIGTSFFSDSGGTNDLYLLGAADDDTDEYDSHVVAHEWGHYFQSALSRDDSVGGAHGGGDKLDMRVAFSEGWGNAWSGIALGDPRYADSRLAGQAGGFINDVSEAPTSNRGWYSEDSVQYLLWQYAQTNGVGFAPMFGVLTGPMRTSSIPASIHQFSSLLKAAVPGGAGAIDALLTTQQITVQDGLGTGERNTGGLPTVPPVVLSLTGVSQQVCVTDTIAQPLSSSPRGNKLGNFAYVRFTASGSKRVTLTTSVGVTDPDIMLMLEDGSVQVLDSESVNSESQVVTLPSGTHTAIVYDFNDSKRLSNDPAVGQRCFTFSVQ
jgi:hypothetical protein